ncbi:MAG: glycyl-radical enzyme activating protein [Spirochaetales bacterium]|uniref:Glycyl-radical enzyme activating protein n=1 Tax=Candidatus Thalassospirochaeta sargassi TaxID=3119039 RepID=A0AAJ1IEC7_9SPIO|nr:glycyl-radical enzyme activating protein [Spirochaetales bacterium]
MKGIIFNIQRFSTKDGPGIRTTVFLKGCNVNCAWCHNPESIDGNQMLRFDSKLCISCGRCAVACPSGATEMVDGRRVYYLDKCTLCGDCVSACGADALEIVGENYTAEELYNIIIKDEDFYKESGGGVTFSGGEPLLQQEFLIEMLRLCKAVGIHTALDTALNIEWDRVEAVLPWVDLVLLDIKGMDSRKHFQNTGVSNELIHKNAVKLAYMGVPIIVRMPVVKELNDSIEELEAAADFMRAWPNLKGVEILPYHSLGVDKSLEYEALEAQKKFKAPDSDFIDKARELFTASGIKIL